MSSYIEKPAIISIVLHARATEPTPPSTHMVFLFHCIVVAEIASSFTVHLWSSYLILKELGGKFVGWETHSHFTLLGRGLTHIVLIFRCHPVQIVCTVGSVLKALPCVLGWRLVMLPETIFEVNIRLSASPVTNKATGIANNIRVSTCAIWAVV